MSRKPRLVFCAFAVLSFVFCGSALAARSDPTPFKFFARNFFIHRVSVDESHISSMDETPIAQVELFKDVDLSLLYGNATIAKTGGEQQTVPLRLKFTNRFAGKLHAKLDYVPFSDDGFDVKDIENIENYDPIMDFDFVAYSDDSFASFGKLQRGVIGNSAVQIFVQTPDSFLINIYDHSKDKLEVHTFVALSAEPTSPLSFYAKYSSYIIFVLAYLGSF